MSEAEVPNMNRAVILQSPNCDKNLNCGIYEYKNIDVLYMESKVNESDEVQSKSCHE